MTTLCFIGLTIQPEEARRHLDAIYFGPASGGDIPAVIAEYKPDTIGIVDGVFHSRPAVLHKDVLHALSRGITVFGAASMGALRAAELDAYGMIGVGEIYRRLRSGEWTGDDEVAIPCIYLPDRGWGPAPDAEALVNMRATIDEAIRRGVVDVKTGQAIIARAKSLCFLERRWDLVLNPDAFAADAASVIQMKRALPELRVDLKRRDAIEMLNVMADWASRDRRNELPRDPPDAPCGPFWDAALFSRPLGVGSLKESRGIDPEDAALVQDVLDHAIVSDPASACLVQDAMIRTLLLELASVLGVEAGKQAAAVAAQRIATDLRAVPLSAPFDPQEISRLGEEEAVCEALHTQYCHGLDRGLLLTLLAEGRFAPIAEAVRAAFSRRARRPPRPPSAEEARAIVETHLGRTGIINAADHWDRYLAWLPEHRLRSAAELLTVGEEVTADDAPRDAAQPAPSHQADQG